MATIRKFNMVTGDETTEEVNSISCEGGRATARQAIIGWADWTVPDWYMEISSQDIQKGWIYNDDWFMATVVECGGVPLFYCWNYITDIAPLVECCQQVLPPAVKCDAMTNLTMSMLTYAPWRPRDKLVTVTFDALPGNSYGKIVVFTFTLDGKDMKTEKVNAYDGMAYWATELDNTVNGTYQLTAQLECNIVMSSPKVRSNKITLCYGGTATVQLTVNDQIISYAIVMDGKYNFLNIELLDANTGQSIQKIENTGLTGSFDAVPGAGDYYAIVTVNSCAGDELPYGSGRVTVDLPCLPPSDISIVYAGSNQMWIYYKSNEPVTFELYKDGIKVWSGNGGAGNGAILYGNYWATGWYTVVLTGQCKDGSSLTPVYSEPFFIQGEGTPCPQVTDGTLEYTTDGRLFARWTTDSGNVLVNLFKDGEYFSGMAIGYPMQNYSWYGMLEGIYYATFERICSDGNSAGGVYSGYVEVKIPEVGMQPPTDVYLYNAGDLSTNGSNNLGTGWNMATGALVTSYTVQLFKLNLISEQYEKVREQNDIDTNSRSWYMQENPKGKYYSKVIAHYAGGDTQADSNNYLDVYLVDCTGGAGLPLIGDDASSLIDVRNYSPDGKSAELYMMYGVPNNMNLSGFLLKAYRQNTDGSWTMLQYWETSDGNAMYVEQSLSVTVEGVYKFRGVTYGICGDSDFYESPAITVSFQRTCNTVQNAACHYAWGTTTTGAQGVLLMYSFTDSDTTSVANYEVNCVSLSDGGIKGGFLNNLLSGTFDVSGIGSPSGFRIDIVRHCQNGVNAQVVQVNPSNTIASITPTCDISILQVNVPQVVWSDNAPSYRATFVTSNNPALISSLDVLFSLDGTNFSPVPSGFSNIGATYVQYGLDSDIQQTHWLRIVPSCASGVKGGGATAQFVFVPSSGCSGGYCAAPMEGVAKLYPQTYKNAANQTIFDTAVQFTITDPDASTFNYYTMQLLKPTDANYNGFTRYYRSTSGYKDAATGKIYGYLRLPTDGDGLPVERDSPYGWGVSIIRYCNNGGCSEEMFFWTADYTG